MTYEQDWLNIYKDKLRQKDTHLEAIDEIEKQIVELINSTPKGFSFFGKHATHENFGDCIIISDEPNKFGEVRIAYPRNGIFECAGAVMVDMPELTIKDNEC